MKKPGLIFQEEQQATRMSGIIKGKIKKIISVGHEARREEERRGLLYLYVIETRIFESRQAKVQDKHYNVRTSNGIHRVEKWGANNNQAGV